MATYSRGLYRFTSNFDQYLICPSGDIVVGCARLGMGFEVNLYRGLSDPR